jgi:predicted DCC family thiol-disulfide oxidoreductase YuxK
VTFGRGLLIYDGDCGFCRAAAAWVGARWRDGGRAAPWQELGERGLARVGLSLEEARSAAWWVDGSGRLSRGELAIAGALAATDGWPATAGRLLARPPLRWLAACIYPFVVRWRHRLPGGTPSCASPGAR